MNYLNGKSIQLSHSKMLNFLMYLIIELQVRKKKNEKIYKNGLYTNERERSCHNVKMLGHTQIGSNVFPS